MNNAQAKVIFDILKAAVGEVDANSFVLHIVAGNQWYDDAHLCFSTRTSNCLKNACGKDNVLNRVKHTQAIHDTHSFKTTFRITYGATVEDLNNLTDKQILSMYAAGKSTLKEIRSELADYYKRSVEF